MQKVIWTIIVAFGLASLLFGGNALAGQGGHAQKAAAHASNSGKHHGKKHQAKHASKHAAKHHKNKSSVSSR